jgi:hypothetical protein
MSPRYGSLDEFWPFYVSQHLHPTTRRLHFAGTTSGMLLVALAAALHDVRLIPAALLCGYAFAWVGHFIFEKNRPATFRHPLLSFRADFRLWWLTLTNQMDAEILLLSAKLKALRAERD